MILPDSDLFSSPASFFLPDPSVPRLLDDLSEASVSLLWRRYREEVFLSGAPLDADELQPRRSKPVGGSFIV
jgi:hypothetical protein